LAGVVVVPDRGGERQQALQHPDEHSAGGVPAVQFQVSWPLRVSKIDSMV
jgi:hypothetical protein